MASGSAAGAVRIPGCLLETREVDGFLANCYRSAAILVHPCAHIEAAVLAWRHVLNGTVWGPAACEQLRDKSGVASAVAQLCSIIRLALQACSTAQNVSCSNNILAALQQELSCHVAQMHSVAQLRAQRGGRRIASAGSQPWHSLCLPAGLHQPPEKLAAWNRRITVACMCHRSGEFALNCQHS